MRRKPKTSIVILNVNGSNVAIKKRPKLSN